MGKKRKGISKEYEEIVKEAIRRFREKRAKEIKIIQEAETKHPKKSERGI